MQLLRSRKEREERVRSIRSDPRSKTSNLSRVLPFRGINRYQLAPRIPLRIRLVPFPGPGCRCPESSRPANHSDRGTFPFHRAMRIGGFLWFHRGILLRLMLVTFDCGAEFLSFPLASERFRISLQVREHRSRIVYEVEGFFGILFGFTGFMRRGLIRWQEATAIWVEIERFSYSSLGDTTAKTLKILLWLKLMRVSKNSRLRWTDLFGGFLRLRGSCRDWFSSSRDISMGLWRY